MHITAVHKKQAIKRTSAKNEETLSKFDEKKKSKKTIVDEPDVSDFDFISAEMETSSQIGAEEHLDRTSNICAEVLQDHLEYKDYDDNDNTLEGILLARANNKEEVNLEETVTPDQDHNYMVDDNNENVENESGDGDENINFLKATVLSQKIDLREKENEIGTLIEENTKLKEDIRAKDEANDALTAKNNSLEDAKGGFESKIKALEATKSKYENRLKTYGATIKVMDAELKKAKSSHPNLPKDKDPDQQLLDLNRKLDKENKDLNDKLKVVTKQSNDKSKDFKQAQAALKKTEASEKELQQVLNKKNGRVSELETANSRLEMFNEHAKGSLQ